MTQKKNLTAALYLQGRKRNSKKTHRKSKQSWYQHVSSLFMQPFATSLNHDRIILARVLNEHSEPETGNPTPDRDQQQKTQTKNPRHLNPTAAFPSISALAVPAGPVRSPSHHALGCSPPQPKANEVRNHVCRCVITHRNSGVSAPYS